MANSIYDNIGQYFNTVSCTPVLSYTVFGNGYICIMINDCKQNWQGCY